MCSILGFIEKTTFADIEIVERMNKVLKHRGPDDDGMDTIKMFGADDPNVGIGFNRLSIRDLTQAGHQPMRSAEGNVIITFNGEIYNADSFRDELIRKGHSFIGTSDTEVLLHLYEEYGIDRMLEMIDGMFAICLIDKKQDLIYLIRDRIGEKPLYYYENNKVYMWASEYKAFYEHPSFVPEMADDNLTEYFMFRYISGGDTLLKNVKNLTPGSFLRIDKDGVTYKKYWDFPEPAGNDPCERKDAFKEFDRLLEKAYRTRLVSDVEVGVQLSGGVDSSCLTNYVSRAVDHKLKTFGIVFDGKDYSEKKYMDQVSSQCDVEPFTYNFSNSSFLSCWILTTYFFEAPMNHEGTLGLFYLNKKAAEKVKVMLCGEGADETMGGYSRFYHIERCKKSPLYRQKYRVRNALKRLIKDRQLDISLLFQRFDCDEAFIRMTQYTDDVNTRTLYPAGDCDAVIRKRKYLIDNMRGNGLRRFMNYETVTYCQDLLMRADKTSMASSLEIRVPYLMPELVEFENRLPDEYFVSTEVGGYEHGTKKLLKERCASLFGEDFTYRPKQGFGIPIMDYFSRGQVKDYIERVLLPSIKRRGILNNEYVQDTYQKKCGNLNAKNDSGVWALWEAFSFEIWAEMYIDRNPNAYFSGELAAMQEI